jgi:hypothetical protein
MPTQDGDLMTQHQQLDLVPSAPAAAQHISSSRRRNAQYSNDMATTTSW